MIIPLIVYSGTPLEPQAPRDSAVVHTVEKSYKRDFDSEHWASVKLLPDSARPPATLDHQISQDSSQEPKANSLTLIYV